MGANQRACRRTALPRRRARRPFVSHSGRIERDCRSRNSAPGGTRRKRPVLRCIFASEATAIISPEQAGRRPWLTPKWSSESRMKPESASWPASATHTPPDALEPPTNRKRGDFSGQSGGEFGQRCQRACGPGLRGRRKFPTGAAPRACTFTPTSAEQCARRIRSSDPDRRGQRRRTPGS